MANEPPPSKPKSRHRDRGDGTIAWDKANRCYVGKLSLGYNSDRKTRNRPSVRGKFFRELGECSASALS